MYTYQLHGRVVSPGNEFSRATVKFRVDGAAEHTEIQAAKDGHFQFEVRESTNAGRACGGGDRCGKPRGLVVDIWVTANAQSASKTYTLKPDSSPRTRVSVGDFILIR